MKYSCLFPYATAKRESYLNTCIIRKLMNKESHSLSMTAAPVEAADSSVFTVIGSDQSHYRYLITMNIKNKTRLMFVLTACSTGKVWLHFL